MKVNLNSSIQRKTATPLTNLTSRSFSRDGYFVSVLALGLFALLRTAGAVSPPPDGGYPGGNTAEGQNALLSLATGGYNTAVGYLSLATNATGQLNTAIGAGTLLANTSDENTATGAAALLSNATGGQNTATGAFALFSNTAGVRNTANGDRALYSNTSGGYNTAYGAGSLALSLEGVNNTSIGFNSLTSHTVGDGNTAVGFYALANHVSGDGNVALGIRAGAGVTTASNVICIGADGADVDNSCYIGNIFGSTSPNGVAVLVDSNGRLGTMTSSKRFKEAIKPMNEASQALFALKPVAFRYNREIDPAGTSQLGLVAEEVEEVNPDLVVHDRQGKPYSVRYDQITAMLLNEFLKEHRTVRDLQTHVVALTATVRNQAAQIQKVSAQLELSKSAPQTVVNDQ